MNVYATRMEIMRCDEGDRVLTHLSMANIFFPVSNITTRQINDKCTNKSHINYMRDERRGEKDKIYHIELH